MMNYEEAIAYYDRIPPFLPRQLAPGEEPFNLRMIERLLDELDHPERELRFVHVAGSNGKGSVCAYLLSILTAAGIRTGLFTSPMLECFEDQFRVGQELIAGEDIATFMTIVREASERIAREGEGTPSAFEQLTVLGFLYFKKMRCELVILETGLGGRLDATNVIPAPLLAVLTPIALEHTQVLGDTLAKIAAEKAGIIKEGSGAVLTAPQEEEAREVIRETAALRGVPLCVAELPAHADRTFLSGQDFTLSFGSDGETLTLHTTLLGSYQVHNASLAACAARLLRGMGFEIPDAAIAAGIETAVWPGRFELLSEAPCIIVDGSHNPHGALSLRESIRNLFPDRKITFITGILADKNCDEILRPLLPLADRFFTITPDSPRALPAAALADRIRSFGGTACPCATIAEALEKALAATPKDGVICAFGSLYSVRELKIGLHKVGVRHHGV